MPLWATDEQVEDVKHGWRQMDRASCSRRAQEKTFAGKLLRLHRTDVSPNCDSVGLWRGGVGVRGDCNAASSPAGIRPLGDTITAAKSAVVAAAAR